MSHSPSLHAQLLLSGFGSGFCQLNPRSVIRFVACALSRLLITCRFSQSHWAKQCSWAIALALLLAVSAAIPAGLLVRVVGVSDGDTITVIDSFRNQYKVRLAGIDAPEKRQAFGNLSRQALASRVFDQHVVIELGKSDRYGRILSKVVINGVDVDLEQIASGMAWHYRKYQKDQTPEDRSAYSSAEAIARKAGIGLWKDTKAIPPWDFRNQKKEHRQ